MTFRLILILLLFPVFMLAQSDSGMAYVRIKKGVVSFRKTIPPEDVQVYITVKLQNEKDGHYRVKYKKGGNTMYDLDKRKVDGPGEAIFKCIGGLIVLTLTVLSVVSRF